MEQAKEILERMKNGETIKNEEFKKDFNKLEEMVMGDADIMQHATDKEVQSYMVINEIPDEDFITMLKNISASISTVGTYTEEELDTILKMEREFLKLLLLERWTVRANANK